MSGEFIGFFGKEKAEKKVVRNEPEQFCLMDVHRLQKTGDPGG